MSIEGLIEHQLRFACQNVWFLLSVLSVSSSQNKTKKKPNVRLVSLALC